MKLWKFHYKNVQKAINMKKMTPPASVTLYDFIGYCERGEDLPASFGHPSKLFDWGYLVVNAKWRYQEFLKNGY